MIDINANTQIFNDYISESALPNIPKNTTLFMDNAAIHKLHKLKDIIDSYDCKLLFSIAYPPEFNPIELFQNVLKSNIISNTTSNFEAICRTINCIFNEYNICRLDNFYKHTYKFLC